MESTNESNNGNLQKFSREDIEGFFCGCVDEVAKELIGVHLFNRTNGRLFGGKIIETEAYCANDPAAHCHPSSFRFKKSNPMGSPGGYVYRHFSRGWCLNLTSGPKSKKFGSAVLIRALQPMRNSVPLADTDLTNVCNGPVKLCKLLGLVDDQYNGSPVWETSLELYRPVGEPDPIVKCGKRVNISEKEAAVWPRSYVLDEVDAVAFLSPPAKKIRDREHYPPVLLKQLKTSGPLAGCMYLSRATNNSTENPSA